MSKVGRGPHAPLLAPSCHGVMGASVRLPWESGCVRRTCMSDSWDWAPLAVRAAPGTRGGKPFMILGMLCTILAVVHERSLPLILGSICSRAPAPAISPDPFVVFHK
jgi:hypothetical protein